MDPIVVETAAPLIALVTLGGFGLLGFRMWLHAKTQRQSMPTEEVRRLRDSVVALGDELRSVQTDMEQLHERVDFAERLLARGNASEQSQTGG